MFYGDGSRNAKKVYASCNGFPPLTDIETVAHEMTHGVTEHNNDLFYQVCMLFGVDGGGGD